MQNILRKITLLSLIESALLLSCLQAQIETPLHSTSTGNFNLPVRACDYCAFLNATAAADPHFFYDKKLGGDAKVACIVRRGELGNYHYEVIAGREDEPITYVNWFGKTAYSAWIYHDQSISLQSSYNMAEELYGITDNMISAQNGDLLLKSNNNELNLWKADSTLALEGDNSDSESLWTKAGNKFIESPVFDASLIGIFLLGCGGWHYRDALGNTLVDVALAPFPAARETWIRGVQETACTDAENSNQNAMDSSRAVDQAYTDKNNSLTRDHKEAWCNAAKNARDQWKKTRDKYRTAVAKTRIPVFSENERALLLTKQQYAEYKYRLYAAQFMVSQGSVAKEDAIASRTVDAAQQVYEKARATELAYQSVIDLLNANCFIEHYHKANSLAATNPREAAIHWENLRESIIPNEQFITPDQCQEERTQLINQWTQDKNKALERAH